MKVFLAGPMLNVMNMHAELFREWTHKLREAGHEVWSPIEYDWDHGFDPRGTGFEENFEQRRFDYRKAYADAVMQLCTWADVLAALPRWERSEGASSQVHIAWKLHIPCYGVANFTAFGKDAPPLDRKLW